MQERIVIAGAEFVYDKATGLYYNKATNTYIDPRTYKEVKPQTSTPTKPASTTTPTLTPPKATTPQSNLEAARQYFATGAIQNPFNPQQQLRPQVTQTSTQQITEAIKKAEEEAKKTIELKIYREVYESANIAEKAALHAHTLLSSKGWEYALSYLPDEAEKTVREGINTIFGWTGLRIDTKPKTPEEVVTEKMKETHEFSQKVQGNILEQFVKHGLEGLTSPVGIAGIESAANIMGGMLVGKIGTSTAQRFVSLGIAGAFEGSVSGAALAASMELERSGDLKGAAIAAAVGGAIGAGIGFLSAGTAGIFYPLGKTTKEKIMRYATTGAAYVLDFPGEAMGDLFTFGTEKVIKPRVATPAVSTVVSNVFSGTPTQTPSNVHTPSQVSTQTSTLTEIFAPVQTPTQTPTQAISQAPAQTPSQIPSQASAPSQASTKTLVPAQTPTITNTIADLFLPTTTPTQTPTKTPTKTPTHVPTQTPSQVPTQTPTNVPTNVPTITPTLVPTPKGFPPFLFPFLDANTVDASAQKRVRSIFVNERKLIKQILGI